MNGWKVLRVAAGTGTFWYALLALIGGYMRELWKVLRLGVWILWRALAHSNTAASYEGEVMERGTWIK